MYAIFEDGSRQYRVEKDSIVVIDYREVERGHLLELPKVLLLQNGADTLIGQPYVDGARLFGEVIDERVKVKTMTQKFRRRKASKRLKGHTQPHIRLKIQHAGRAGQHPADLSLSSRQLFCPAADVRIARPRRVCLA